MDESYLLFDPDTEELFGKAPDGRIFKLNAAVFAAEYETSDPEADEQCFAVDYWLPRILPAAQYFGALEDGQQPAGYYLADQEQARRCYAELWRKLKSMLDDTVSLVPVPVYN